MGLVSNAPDATADDAQAELPGIADAFRAVGLDNVPVGIAQLTRRQRVWLLQYLRTGNSTEAARLAGYSSPESDGSKVRKNAGIMACLAHAMIPVAKSVDQLVLRAANRSRALHDLLMQELEKGPDRQSTERVKWLTSRVDRTDMLLATLLGKVVGVHLSGELAHSHQHTGEVAITLPATALPVLAQMRRDVVLTRGQQPLATGEN